MTGKLPSYWKWRLSRPDFKQEYFGKMKLGEEIFIYLFIYSVSSYLTTFFLIYNRREKNLTRIFVIFLSYLTKMLELVN